MGEESSSQIPNFFLAEGVWHVALLKSMLINLNLVVFLKDTQTVHCFFQAFRLIYFHPTANRRKLQGFCLSRRFHLVHKWPGHPILKQSVKELCHSVCQDFPFLLSLLSRLPFLFFFFPFCLSLLARRPFLFSLLTHRP